MKALLRSSLVLVLAAGLLAGCERPPVDSVQRGFRGTGMVGVYNPRTVAMQVPNNQPPAPQGPSAGPNPGGPTAGQVSPLLVSGLTTWSSVSAGEAHSAATRANGTMWAWGQNAYGQLGDGTTDSRTSPVQVGSATTWSSVSAGDRHTVATRTDGTLWAWGGNA